MWELPEVWGWEVWDLRYGRVLQELAEVLFDIWHSKYDAQNHVILLRRKCYHLISTLKSKYLPQSKPLMPTSKWSSAPLKQPSSEPINSPTPCSLALVVYKKGS